MLYSKDVEVADIDTTYDPETEEPYYRIRFGVQMKVTPELAARVMALKDHVGEKVVTASAEVIATFTAAPPFYLGAKYTVSVDNDGTVTIKPRA